MIDREKIRRRVVDKINYGYSTHRVMNRILEETMLELADVLIEELDREFYEKPWPSKKLTVKPDKV